MTGSFAVGLFTTLALHLTAVTGSPWEPGGGQEPARSTAPKRIEESAAPTSPVARRIHASFPAVAGHLATGTALKSAELEVAGRSYAGLTPQWDTPGQPGRPGHGLPGDRIILPSR